MVWRFDMRGAVILAVRLAVFVLAVIVIEALWGWFTGNTRSLWESVMLGTVLGTGTGVVSYCEKRGWIKFGPPIWSDGSEQRKKELAQERAQIMADAIARKEAQAHGE